jgi:hypothetical protein
MPAEPIKQLAYEYVAYIDEAGDPGLSRVKPYDNNGSSEWLVVSAVVVRRVNEDATVSWVRAITSQFNNHHANAFHFSKLNPAKKITACNGLASREARLFVVASNKKNMKGHTNPFAELKSLDKNWFYCWLTRILLERVTHWVEKRAMKEFGEPRKLKLVFSSRGGLSYSQMKAYFELLKVQSRGQSLFLPTGDLRWGVVQQDLTEIRPHYERAGLQLADVAASSFFKACDKFDTGFCDPRFAKILKPRVASIQDDDGYQIYAGYGVKLLPSFRAAKLLPEQKEIFKHYGYPIQWWDPTSSTPGADSPASRC